MATDQEIAQMPIQEVVKLPGGNGLASPAFQVPLNILFIYGWHNIEQGVEACVCDGVRIPRTQLRAEFMRLMGRKNFVRRVLLKPPPLEISATGLTQDQLKLTLSIAVKFEVSDVEYIASLSEPVRELKNIFEGMTSEYIRSHSFSYFINDKGDIRAKLKEQFERSETIKDRYLINEVLKAIPTGDETLIEINRKTEAAKKQSGLIDAEGVNKETEAKHNLAIAREQAKLEDEIAQRKHEREKAIRELEAKEEILKTALTALGQVAAAGIDPSKVTQDVIGSLTSSVQNTRLAAANTPTLLESQQSQPVIEIKPKEINQLEMEKLGLESIKNKLGITTYEILETNSKVRGALIQFKGYEIIFTCGDNYPSDEPTASVRFLDGTGKAPGDYWIPGLSNTLAQAVLAIIPQIRPDGK